MAPSRGRPGDTNRPEDTARASARLNAEQQAAKDEAARTMAMASSINAVNESDGLYDGKSGELVESGLSDVETAQVAQRYQVAMDEDFVTDGEDAKLDNTGFVRPPGIAAVGPLGLPIDPEGRTPDDVEMARASDHVLAAASAEAGRMVQQYLPPEPAPVVPVPRQERQVIIRVADDIQPTIGAGSTWDFKRGKRYKVPEYVANHLNEKGLVLAFG
jgi:hypothetical protein